MKDSEEKTAILVVDDERIVTSLICDALEGEDYQVETTQSSEHAIEMSRNQDFDLVISDIRMPRMDGIEMIKKIKEIQPGIGIIFMTGYANLQSAKNAIKQGASDYIMKPFELSEMRQAVHNAISMKRAANVTSSDHHLDNLTDLNRMLFEAGDRRGLIVASLRFAMIHQRAELGTVIYNADDADEAVITTFNGDSMTEKRLPAHPLIEVAESLKLDQAVKPYVVSGLEDFSFYLEHPDPRLKEYLIPDWLGEEDYMIWVPVIRGGVVHCGMLIKFQDDTVRLRETSLKFLFMVASQLAITLENLTLLDQSRQAYLRLKELQDQTIELEKMATRGEISAQIGHELNNFLGVVSGNLSLLEVNLVKKNYDKLNKYMHNMADTIDKIKTFTSNLMDLTPISSKKETLLFDTLLAEVIEYLKPQRRYEGIEIRTRHITEGISFEADSTQIQQLLYNLFNNAADAMSNSDTRTITIDLERTDNDHQFRFRITDTGMGIEPDLLEKVFQKQFTTKATGHGFGLMVCKQIIENHGGELKIESVVGQGTAVSILFPMAGVPVLVPEPA